MTCPARCQSERSRVITDTPDNLHSSVEAADPNVAGLAEHDHTHQHCQASGRRLEALVAGQRMVRAAGGHHPIQHDRLDLGGVRPGEHYSRISLTYLEESWGLVDLHIAGSTEMVERHSHRALRRSSWQSREMFVGSIVRIAQ